MCVSIKVSFRRIFSMIEVGTQEKIVEFEIPVFETVETCVVAEFEYDETDELDVEIPMFMRG